VKEALKILIVDDSDFDRERVIRALKGDQENEYTFQQMDTGDRLEETVSEWNPDIIILDFDLPGSNGLEILKRVALANGGKLNLPIVMATGTGNENVAVEAMKLGALDYVVKDQLTPLLVREVVARALEKSRGQLRFSEQENLLKDHQTRLALSEGHFRTLAEALPGIVWTADKRGEIDYFNPAWTDYTGLLIEDGTQSKLSSFIHPDDLERTSAEIAASIRSGTPLETEYRLMRKDGVYHWHLAKSRAHLDPSGQVIRWFGTLIDIEDQKRAIQELTAEQALRERFVATLSHDLRNPLAAAKMSAQILEKFPEREELRAKQIPMIISNLERVDQMIKDLLDASRLKAGQAIQVKSMPCDLIQIAYDAIGDLFHIHGDRFIFSTDPGTEFIPGNWSPGDLKRVIENLAGNAIKYGDPTQKITLTVGLENDLNAFISVHNWGNPLTNEEQRRLFDPFERAASAEKSKKLGWGLGLALVRGIAETHCGSVDVQSSKEKGTLFTFRIPVNPAALVPAA
jgi:PAS domain S-box-containing protein